MTSDGCDNGCWPSCWRYLHDPRRFCPFCVTYVMVEELIPRKSLGWMSELDSRIVSGEVCDHRSLIGYPRLIPKEAEEDAVFCGLGF